VTSYSATTYPTVIDATFLPVREYVTFGYMLSHVRLSVVCHVRVSYTQPVDIFGNVPMPFCTLAIR